MAVSAAYAATCTVTETLDGNTDSAADANRQVVHSNFNESTTLNSGSTPPATKCAHFVLALTAGAASINLAALTGTNGATVDGTGLKVQVLRIKNLGANNMTFAEGASNGYAFFGTSGLIVVPPGAHVMYFSNDASPDIAAADRTIDVTGTGSQTAEITVVMG